MSELESSESHGSGDKSFVKGVVPDLYGGSEFKDDDVLETLFGSLHLASLSGKSTMIFPISILMIFCQLHCTF